MSYDLVIKNGTVVDGTGMPSAKTDVAIRAGKIVARGRIEPGAAKVIDAEGKIVAPGFIDVHTHYDAQLLWDPWLTCSPWHGATSVVMGNCGYSLAPALPRDRQYLAEMFSEVEGMNLKALQQGITWQWETFPQFLDFIASKQYGVNIASMVGHSALRRFALGEESSQRESTPAEIQVMKQALREAMAAGAFGFSTSRSPTHKSMDQLPVPSRLSSREEVLELATVLREFHVGGIAMITESVAYGPERFPEAEQQFMMDASKFSGRPVNYNGLNHDWAVPTRWKHQLEFLARANAEGAQVYGVARCQRLDIQFTLDGVSRFGAWPKWKEILSRPRAELAALLRTPDVRAALKAEAQRLEETTPVWNRLGSIAFVGSKSGRYAKYQRRLLKDVAKELGTDTVDLLLDWSLAEDFNADFAFVGFRNGDPDAVAAILKSPYTLVGTSDAGAHTNTSSGAFYSTFLLGHWVRDKGLLTLEEAVRRLTSAQASVFSLWDRGMIREGMAADIVIFDLKALDWLPAERFKDFPGGEERLANHALGYEHLIVNGEVVMHGNTHTGALPGRVLRSSAYRDVD